MLILSGPPSELDETPFLGFYSAAPRRIMRPNFLVSHFKKPIKLALIAGLWLAVLGNGLAQPQFYNFNFEMASNLPAGSPGPPYYGPGGIMSSADAFPGWTTYINGNPTSSALYDLLTLGSASISLLDSNAQNSANLVIQGKFSAVLQSGNVTDPVTGHLSPIEPVTIGQTGQIPAWAQSLRFSAFTGSFPGAVFVTFNGQNVPLLQLDATDFAGDISAYEGQTGELSFGAQPVINDLDPREEPFLTDTVVALDDIAFSVQPVPEPKTIGLILCGAALAGFNRRRCFFLRRVF
jgi:hypothetical protein